MKIMSVAAPYRLTNPRKLFRAITILALASSFSIAGISGSVATNTEPVALEYITVGHGDSLWALARSYAPNQDPRDWIASVVSLNALSTASLEPGQRIALPR
jgi:peptidoglycan/LPS O-acetylase OafA/YrhL